MSKGEIQILDFSNSQLISINTGQTKIQNGNFKLIHTIDLNQYENCVAEILAIIDNNEGHNSTLLPYITHEINQIQNLITNLKPKRYRRAMDFLGTAWKFIAGSPDHEDFRTIKQVMTNVLENNNRQVIINNLLTERLNNATKINNEIRKLLSNDRTINNEILTTLQYKIKLVKEELRNINYAIHWSKLGIINSLILSNKEINLALKTLKEENFPFSSIEEAMNFAEIKIMTNSTSILYIVNIPVTDHKTYQKILLKPVKRNNIVIEITHENVIKHNNAIFGIKDKCKCYNNLSICKDKNLINLSNSTCIVNLLKSVKANCNIINNQHVPHIEEISSGVILLNNFNGTILINSEPQDLNGTFLVKFHNASITVEGKTFTSYESSNFEVLPAILHPLPKELEFRKLLSLEMINELHINNTKAIEWLQTSSILTHSTTYLIITAIVVLVIIITLKVFKHNGTKIVIHERENKSENGEEPENKKPSSSLKVNFNAIPFF